jgi:hypothetical protein
VTAALRAWKAASAGASQLLVFVLAAFCCQNHYHVMLLFSQGCRIFQSLQIFRVFFFKDGKSLIMTSLVSQA